jgi:hypothetical protein
VWWDLGPENIEGNGIIKGDGTIVPGGWDVGPEAVGSALIVKKGLGYDCNYVIWCLSVSQQVTPPPFATQF